MKINNVLNSTKCLLIFLFTALFLFSCSSYKKNIKPQDEQIQKDSVITVGWIGPLIGPTSPFGIDSLKAVELAIDEYNSTRSEEDPFIQLKVEDDRYEGGQTVIQYKKLLHFDHPFAIFAITYDGVIEIGTEATKDSILLIDSLDSDQNLANAGNNVFLISKETDELAGLYVEALIDKGARNIAVIYNDGDEFMNTLGVTIKQIFQKSDIKPIFYSYHYNPDLQDFTDVLNRAKESGADSYLFLGYMEVAEAMKQARAMGINEQFYSGSIVTDPDFLEKTKGISEGTYFVHFTKLDGNKQKAEEFLRKYKNKFHMTPAIEWSAFQSYDAANMLILAIKKAYEQKGKFSDNLRRALLTLPTYDGVTGNITIQQNRAVRGIYPSLYVIKDGKPAKVIK